MKIQIVNNLIQVQPRNNKNSYCSSKPLAYDSLEIDFKGLAQKRLKMQALKLQQEAYFAYKEAGQIKNDSYAVLKEAEKYRVEATKVLRDSKKELKEVLEFLKQGQLTNHDTVYNVKTGEILREFVDGAEDEDEDDNSFVMWEYDSKGYPIRKTVVDDYIIKIVIPDYDSKDSRVYIFDKTGNELIHYIENITLKRGGYEADKQFVFSNSRLVTFDKKYKYKEQKGESAVEHFSYLKSKLNTYCAEWFLSTDGMVEKAQDRYEYRDSILNKAYVDFEDVDGEYSKSSQEYSYDSESGFKNYAKDSYNPKKASEKRIKKTYFAFGDEGLRRIYIDLEVLPIDKKYSASQMFVCKNEKPAECKFNYIYTDGKEVFSKMEKVS